MGKNNRVSCRPADMADTRRREWQICSAVRLNKLSVRLGFTQANPNMSVAEGFHTYTSVYLCVAL